MANLYQEELKIKNPYSWWYWIDLIWWESEANEWPGDKLAGHKRAIDVIVQSTCRESELEYIW